MKLLDRYIGMTVLQSTAIVLVVLLTLFGFLIFFGEFSDIGRGNYGSLQAGIYSVLLIPGIAYQMFPLAVLIGSIIGLGILASNSELLVIRAAGVSIQQVIWSVMKVGLLLMLVMVAVGEFLAPASEMEAQRLRAQALSEKISFRGDMGLWARDGDSVVHIRDLPSAENVGNVSIYQFDAKQHLRTITVAKQANFENGGWVLKDVSRSILTDNSVRTTREAQLPWQTMLEPKMIGVVTVDPDKLTTPGIFHYIHYLHENGLDAAKYVFALWKKALSPLVLCVMIILAVPFVFGPLRSVGIGSRIFFGTLLGIGFYLLDQTAAQLGLVYGFPPWLAVSVVPLSFLGIAIMMVLRTR